METEKERSVTLKAFGIICANEQGDPLMQVERTGESHLWRGGCDDKHLLGIEAALISSSRVSCT